MADLTAAQAAEIRGEIAELRVEYDRRLKELEERLETRIAAAERKHLTDLDQVNQQISALVKELAALRGKAGELESLVRANHYAEMHLWAATARLLKMPEKEIDDTQKFARAIFEGAPRG